MSNCGIAIIGSGYWGKNLVRNYHQLGALRLVCDKNEAVLSLFREQYPGISTCVALNDVLTRQDVEGVVIATPAETHYNLAREALLAGKHVYVEKPLVLDETEAQDLIETAEEAGRILMVGHLLQFHPAFVRLKNMAASGELGRINYIYSNRLNLGKIRREENALWSFAPHDISMILSLAGEDPEQVSCTGGNYLHRKLADVTTTHLAFPSGLRAHVFVSWLHPFKEQKLVVVGDRKMAVFDDTQPWEQKLLLYAHEIRWENNLPVPAKAEPELVDVPKDEPLKLECECFLDSISNGRKPLTDGSEGLRVLRILNASQRSLDDGGCIVELGVLAGKKHPVTKISKPRSVSHPDTLSKVFVHETSVVDDGCMIGEGTKIWHFSHIVKGSRIGAGCNIGQNVVVGPEAVIGDNCKIQNNVSVFKGVTLEEGVFCGPSMVFTNVYNPRAEIRKMDQLRTTLVKRGATIGANATIVCGATLGRYCFIGAGAVVVRDVPDHALVVGNPAHVIGFVCECGERLTDKLKCGSCDSSYVETPHGIRGNPSERKS